LSNATTTEFVNLRKDGSRIHVGTAAWVNPPRERLRRGPASHLVHYSKTFNAVEINSSFYRSHRRVTYERWREITPASFRFSVKMPRSVTHDCALRRCHPELRQFLDEISGLGRKLGVILVQLPASLALESRVAARFFDSLTAQSSARVACEPRHPSWFTARAGNLLQRHGVARVAADPSTNAGADLPGGSSTLVYYRLHGSPRMYYSAYSAEFMSHLAVQVRGSISIAKDVWCIFDNTARYEAWPNAQQLLSLLK
jgi:uncharacterized protein YecE (DUF72 family)